MRNYKSLWAISSLTPPPHWRLALWMIISWLVIITISGWVRPIFPSNELRYISVAWEMWTHHSFIVPLQGDLPYAHKPPLLFWLVQIGWWLFGVNSWWPRLVPELFGLATLLIIYLLSRALWREPEQVVIATLSPVILLGMVGWISQLDLFKFDVMLSFFVITTLYATVKALKQANWWPWCVVALLVALSILAKGPVCCLFLMPPLLLIPWWWRQPLPDHFYSKLMLTIGIAILLVLSWALPAAYLGGKLYAQAIFWHQSAGRIAGEFGGVKHWYAYFIFLAWLLFPWTLWPPLWQSGYSILRHWRSYHQDSGLRLLLCSVIPAFVLLTLIPMKSERFIMPLLPLVAVFFAYCIATSAKLVNSRYQQTMIALIYFILGLVCVLLPIYASPQLLQRFFWLPQLSPIWGYALLLLSVLIVSVCYRNSSQQVLWLTCTSVIAFVIYNVGIVKIIAPYNDLRPMAAQLAKLQRHGYPIALYHSDFEFEFFGRLNHSSTLLSSQEQLRSWQQHHANGWIVHMDKSVYPPRYVLSPAAKKNILDQ